jgi:hypothetical protein
MSRVASNRPSKVAIELRGLGPKLRSQLGVSDALVEIVEGVVAACDVLSDPGDDKPLLDRLEALEPMFSSLNDVDAEAWVRAAEGFVESDLSLWVGKVQNDGFDKFVRRLVGAAAHDRLKSALREDGAVCLIAARRALRGLLPFFVALDDCAAPLTPAQLAALPSKEAIATSLMKAAVEVEQLIDRGFETLAVPFERIGALPEEQQGIVAGDLVNLVKTLRVVISGRSRESLEQLNATLARKIKGARDALDYSADPVSQCANSLIELIDRLLRGAFPTEYVIGWIGKNFPQRSELTYLERNGAVRPTKRAEALCFAYAGADVGEPSLYHELSAASLIAVRTSLQQLKHADLGTPEEQATVAQHLAAVEGFITLALRVSWAAASEESITGMRERLAA